jgi:hypothetical protein
MNADLKRKADRQESNTKRLKAVHGHELRLSPIESMMLSAFIGVHRRHQYAVS